MEQEKRNFNGEETFITEYRIKESQTDKQTLSKNYERFMKTYIDFIKRSRSNFGYEEVPNEEERFARVLKK